MIGLPVADLAILGVVAVGGVALLVGLVRQVVIVLRDGRS